MNQEQENEQRTDIASTVRLFLGILEKRKWIAISIVVLATGLSVLFSSRQKPVYRATASVIIDRRSPTVLSRVQEVMELGSGNYWSIKEYMETQYEILKSRRLLKRVVDKLALGLDSHFLELDFMKPKLGGAELRQAIAKKDPISLLASRVSVEPKKDSQMVLVSVEHSDPRLAQELANTLVAEYKEENLEYKRRVVSEAILELRSMMLRLRQDKEEARARVLEFERRYSMSSLESRQEQVADQLKQLGTEYLSSVIQRADVESSREREELSTRIAEMAALLDSKDYSDVSHPVLVNSSSIITLKLRLVDLDTEVRKTAGRYGPKHPIMQAAYAQRSLVRKALLKESRILLESELKSSKDLLEKENNKLHKAIEMEQKLLVELNDSKEEESRLAKLQLDYRPLRDRANEAGKLFEDVKARYTETTLSAQVETNNVRIQDLATMPIDPVRPNKKLNVSLGLLVGLMLGIGAAYFVETLDSSLKTREDIEATGKVDFLGIVPAVDDLVAPDPTNINKSTELFAFHHPKASVSENIRTIKTNLFFSRPGGRPSRILVTSPGPKEGKTTVGCNLAAVAAMAGARTLVVDTDMRRPRVHRLFGIPRRPGVTEFLMGSMPISSFCRPTPVEGLDVLTCGTLAPNPLEVLESKKFWQMVDELSTLYDIVVFDSPPLLAVADAKIICSSVDVVVLVVRAGQTTKEGLREARGMLYPMVDEDVGVVLNGFDAERHSYRYYYYRSKAYTYYNYYSYEDSGADSETGVQEEDSVRSASWGKRSA